MFYINHMRDFYGRFERPISSLSLLAGFAFDAITLKRVDAFWENFWIVAHLVIVGVFIMLIHTQESNPGDEKNPSKVHFWYVNILQFFFGGILSAYLVFYFRSADLFVTWPFMLVLALAFLANERLKRHYIRLSFQISLFFLSIYSFAIFLIPVIRHKIGTETFLLSGVVSLGLITLFILILFSSVKENFNESKRLIIGLIAAIFITVNFLYFTNLIPPIPLSLKEAGVYYSIEKNSDSNYVVEKEDHSWKNYFSLYPNFDKEAGQPIYAYSAIFSPSGLNITIIHDWQEYDEATGKWISKNTVRLPVIGGRDGGFRTYSFSTNPEPGKWRVNISTEDGKLIGRLRFRVVSASTEPVRTIEVK